MNIDRHTLAGVIDSTLLQEGTTKDAISRLCKDAITHQFCAVCVPPGYVNHALSLVYDTAVRVVSVVSFPHGTKTTFMKCRQAEQIIKEGADEVDMVMNLEWFINGQYHEVVDDILNIVVAAKSTPCRRFLSDVAVVKVIIETALLRDEERKNNLTDGYLIQKAGELVAKAQADFVKTSTGKHPAGGVQTNDVALIKSVIPDSVKIKAAGGIKTWKHVEQLLKERVDRIGTSSAAAIMGEFNCATN